MVVSSAGLMPSLLTTPLPTKSDGKDRRSPFQKLCADGCFSFWHKQGGGGQWNRHRIHPEGWQPQVKEQPGAREDMEMQANSEKELCFRLDQNTGSRPGKGAR